MEHAVRDEIVRFVLTSPENRRREGEGSYFDEPLVGYASTTDPLFEEYKRIIGPFHRTPASILAGNPDAQTPLQGTVICWILPITRATRESNRRERVWPSREWAHTRNYGEEFNALLRRHLVAFLLGHGHRAIAPQLSPDWKRVDDPPAGIASTWSERHAAYAAGLGTFSLNDGLITGRGIAHRCGSVITTLVLPPTNRPDADHRWNCLHFREGGCGICIDRCPAGALSREGHDKPKCRDYCHVEIPRAVGERHQVPENGCGLCQTMVPCEGSIPRGKGRMGPGATKPTE
ncbi:MAG: epoxyqueuosine reductase [Deltaproteobacteria bacterium]|nr:epoxyqueuosine reductase [Deltaproteobacteria bacterium]